MLDATGPIDRFTRTVRSDAWTSLFPALEELCQARVGHRLFSCSAFQMSGSERGVAARIYTSDAKNYPVSGLKDIVPNRWTDLVLRRRQLFVANSADGFSDVFPDHALITSLGLGSVVNLPVVLGGNFIGTVNLLHTAGHYTEARVASFRALELAAVLSFVTSADLHHSSPDRARAAVSDNHE